MRIMLIPQLLLSFVYGAQSNLPVWPDDFRWASAGKPADYNCIQIHEAADPHTWHDNYLCWRNFKRNPGIKWRSWGKIRSMRCTQIIERSDPHSWHDNYLCERHDSPYRFSWHSSGKPRGKSCIQWIENSDPHTWHDNYLCANLPNSRLPDPVFPTDFKWSSTGIPSGYDCEKIEEKSDPHTWNDNYFCWKTGTKYLGIRWSSSGKIHGKRCTQVIEPSDPHTWSDNYLCLSHSAGLRFYWSYGGPLRGKTCLRWNEDSDPHGWRDNFLCSNQGGNLRNPVFPNDFKWSSTGVPLGYDCERILESYHSWDDNYLCWRHGTKNPGIRWSSSGPVRGMRCTQINEPSGGSNWNDNYLCIPNSSPLRFYWSFNGHPRGKNCLRWIENSSNNWHDNYLCTNKDNLPNPVFPTDFKWSSAGVPTGYDCEKISEVAGWDDNYFCWKHGTKYPGIRWSNAGPIRGMRCIKINEPSEPHSWDDNYLCVPYSSSLRFSWSCDGQLRGKTCLKWYEDADPHGWHDNFLCSNQAPNLRDPVFPNDFKWSSAGVPVGYDCERILEESDPHSWQDNYFCWKQETKYPGIKWSMIGPIGGMRCVQVNEPSDPHTWSDNYLCVPNSSKLRFIWSFRGRKHGHDCIQWQESSDPHTWSDNYICDEQCKLYSCITPKDYKKSENRCLHGHVYNSYSDKTLAQCASVCDSIPRCKSFNWRPLKGSNCEVAIVSKLDVPGSYRDCFENGWHYYEKMTFKSDLTSSKILSRSLSSQNWMEGLDESLSISLFSIPGTHDSAARDHSLEFVNCQALNIRSQLEIGVRFFDMRVAVKGKGRDWVMMHGSFDLDFNFYVDMLRPIYDFLSKYPSECVIMRIKKEGSAHLPTEPFVRYSQRNPTMWLLQNRIPTLEECRGKIFALRDEWELESREIRSWSNNENVTQDKYDLKDELRRRGILDDIGKFIGGKVEKTAINIWRTIKNVGDISEAFRGRDALAKYLLKVINPVASTIVDLHLSINLLTVILDGVHGLLDLDGKDAELQKLFYIVDFHRNRILNNFNVNKLYVNFWSYFGYSRLGIPQFNRDTAEKMRRLDIIPQLEGSKLGICVFDFPTQFQVEQVFCRNYGKMNGGCL